LNLFHGGTEIANSAMLRPWASTGGDYDLDQNYFINIAPGTVIDGSGSFVSGESGSYLHFSSDLIVPADKFQTGVTGYLAFEYTLSEGGGNAYGWMSFTPSDSGVGFALDVVRSDTPDESLTVGIIPEPSVYTALAGALTLGFAVWRRRSV
jgi:hypothetical protein